MFFWLQEGGCRLARAFRRADLDAFARQILKGLGNLGIRAFEDQDRPSGFRGEGGLQDIDGEVEFFTEVADYRVVF